MTFVKVAKGRVTDDIDAIVKAGETIIHQGHWNMKIIGKSTADTTKNEKELLAVLKVADSRKIMNPAVSK